MAAAHEESPPASLPGGSPVQVPQSPYQLVQANAVTGLVRLPLILPDQGLALNGVLTTSLTTGTSLLSS